MQLNPFNNVVYTYDPNLLADLFVYEYIHPMKSPNFGKETPVKLAKVKQLLPTLGRTINIYYKTTD